MTAKRKTPPIPTNELFKLDLGTESEFFWTHIKNDGVPQPPARWNHSATKIDQDRIIIFGGFCMQDTQSKLNDVWILDTKTDTWITCNESQTCEFSCLPNMKNWLEKSNMIESPCPRGAHSASVIGNLLLIFGGYGGFGYTRRDFSDLIAFCLENWTWYEIKTNGSPPPSRSGHQSAAVNNCLYIMGGWSTSQQFDDVHILDGNTLSWSQPMTACGPENWGIQRWNFAAVPIFAVPYWKIFIFGGNSGNLDSFRPQGYHCNDIQVLECIESSAEKQEELTWSKYNVKGDVPSPRSDTSMIYVTDLGKLICFGGWSNRWHDELYTCDVQDVVGPPYNIFLITSTKWTRSIGPVTGESEMMINGKGFLSCGGGVATIRFACQDGYEEVTGNIIDDEKILFETPNFVKYGPGKVQTRLKIGPKSFATNSLDFNYFSVTDNTQSVAFGPGLIDGNKTNNPCSFIIQAKDHGGDNRSCGMDEFKVAISKVRQGNDKTDIEFKLNDNDDGTYTVEYTLPESGEYLVEIIFLGTFCGPKGHIRGSPFCIKSVETTDASNNKLDGPLLQKYIESCIDSLKTFSNNTIKGIGKVVSNDDMKGLVAIKEHLRNIKNQTVALENTIVANRAALTYLKRKSIKIPKLDQMLKNLDHSSRLWSEVKEKAPLVWNQISEADQIWVEKTKFKIEAYEKELQDKVKQFRKRKFWQYYNENGARIEEQETMKSISDTNDNLESEIKILRENSYICDIFDLQDDIKTSENIMNEMKIDLEEMKKLWKISKNLDQFIISMESLKWSGLDIEYLEDRGKEQLKAVKSSHKCVRWSEAFKETDKKCKDFISTIPLVSLLRSDAMRPRHWDLIKNATGKSDFVPPNDNESMTLGNILGLDLHKTVNEVEEICDQASKEEKMETTLAQIESRWLSILFTMTPYIQPWLEDEIPLLGIGEEDFEALENDQLVVQGMLASRFVAQFEKEVNSWHKSLFNINETLVIISDIQRTWSYLEPLFIHSDEVKRELPEDATRFATIDCSIKLILKKAWNTKIVNSAFNEVGLYERLDKIQEQLDLCKKSLADFLDGRRRQFPRYYFVSEADLLDILSNGSNPEKILCHIPKVYLSTKSLVLSSEKKSPSGRPIATEFVAGVGSEICALEPPVALDGKVEIYMQTVLDAQKYSLFQTVKRSLGRYHQVQRPDWILSKDDNGRPLDPAQTTLLVLAINYVEEVEKTFRDIQDGNANALEKYSEKQINQLSDLVKLTQSDLSKGDRTRVMVCITMDAHARDIVEKMIRNNIKDSASFMWQSQLKHKFRRPPKHARYQNRNRNLRGDDGERAEIAICDAILPYDYEYLGNGPRLVITPLTDRVYVTATQALNLKMGCAPAGPAGTGKTETTKDLANALAKLIYVINCKYLIVYHLINSFILIRHSHTAFEFKNRFA